LEACEKGVKGIEGGGNVEVSRGIGRHTARKVIALVGEMKYGYFGSGCGRRRTFLDGTLSLGDARRRKRQQTGKGEQHYGNETELLTSHCKISSDIRFGVANLVLLPNAWNARRSLLALHP
jgi:hypothetical protein